MALPEPATQAACRLEFTSAHRPRLHHASDIKSPGAARHPRRWNRRRARRAPSLAAPIGAHVLALVGIVLPGRQDVGGALGVARRCRAAGALNKVT